MEVKVLMVKTPEQPLSFTAEDEEHFSEIGGINRETEGYSNEEVGLKDHKAMILMVGFSGERSISIFTD